MVEIITDNTNLKKLFAVLENLNSLIETDLNVLKTEDETQASSDTLTQRRNSKKLQFNDIKKKAFSKLSEKLDEVNSKLAISSSKEIG